MAGRLQDKIAIITGAGRGIGAQTARRFLEEGARVAIAELNAETGEATAAGLRSEGYQAVAVQTDVSNHGSVKRMVAAVVDALGPPDILVNNAGINVFRDPLQLTDEDWRKCFGVNLDGMWYCIREVLPHMLAKGGGSVVNIASVHAMNIIPGCFPYPVAKHAVLGLTRALAIEYAAQDIRLNAVCPGYVETQITIDYWNAHPDPESQRLYAYNLHPPKRIGTTDEIAMTVVFLASDEARFINGATVVVDGGRSILYHD